jgi:hypothetical protein
MASLQDQLNAVTVRMEDADLKLIANEAQITELSQKLKEVYSRTENLNFLPNIFSKKQLI